MRNYNTTLLPVSALLALLAVSGCATPAVAPLQSQPLTPAALAVSEAATPFAADWWRALNDASLEQLLAQALRSNPGLDAADARLRAARADIAGVASNDGLKVNGNLGASRARTSEFDALPPAMLGQWTTLQTVSADFSYRFDFWGKTRAQLAAARGQARAAELEASDARQSVAYALVDRYVEWRGAQAALTLLQQDRQQAASLLQNAEQRVKHGLAQPDEVLQARAQLADSDERLLRGEQRISAAAHALAALSAQPQAAIDALPAAALPQWTLDTAPLSSGQLGLRADVQAARERVEASRGNVAAARADFYPDVRLNMMAGLSAQELSDLFSPGARVLRLAPALTLPLFSNGELNARLDSRSAELEAAIASYNQTLLNAIRDTADHSSQLARLRQAEAAKQQALLARRDSVAKVQSRASAGLTTPASLLAEQRQLTQARLAALELHTQRLQSQAALIRTLGTAPAATR